MTKQLTAVIVVIFELIFVRKDTLAHIQSLIAPVLVPMAPAVLLGSKVFETLEPDTNWTLALVVSIASVVGVEAVGGLSSYTAVLKATRRDWWGLFFAAIGVTIYIIALVVSMMFFEAPAFGFFAILTPAAFIVAALFAADGVKRSEQMEDTQLDIAKINAEKNKINAETRRLKQGNRQDLDLSILSNSRPVASTGQMDIEITSIGQAVIDLCNQEGKLSSRKIAEKVGCSPQTALNWRKYWEANN